MHLYLKYQSPKTFGSKDIVQVNVFFQDQGHKVKSLGTKTKQNLIGSFDFSEVFYAPVSKDRGHLVFGLSVCLQKH
jgi:hypothetical protein